jgi:four helix bundle protein
MPTIRNFEDMDVWQRARKLTQEVYAISNAGIFSKDFALRDQIRRASISVMANIAEGFERNGRSEFIQFLSIAKGSVGEVRSHLYVAGDQGYIGGDLLRSLVADTEEIGRMVGGLIDYLRRSRIRGAKYRSGEGRENQPETLNSKPETF